ncbi:MAG: LamG-like jellyroll fold domain-containing protein [Verrucomicrobiales bacterium]
MVLLIFAIFTKAWCLPTGAQSLADGLVVYATMDGAEVLGTRVVGRVEGTDGHISNSAGIVRQAGMFDGGLDFLNTTGYISFAKAPRSGDDGYSASIWIRSSGFGSLLETLPETSSGSGWRASYLGRLEFEAVSVGATEGEKVTMMTELNWPGAWHHVACVLDPVLSKWVVYLDGESVRVLPDNQYPYSPPFSDTFREGASFSSSRELRVGGSHYATGTVDDLAVWTRTLSADEVRTIHAAGRAGKSLGEISNAGQPPVFAVRPVGGSFSVGQSIPLVATLSRSDGNAQELDYQWFKNLEAIESARSAEWLLEDAGLNDAGAFQLAVSGPGIAGLSPSAQITISGLATRTEGRLRHSAPEDSPISIDGDLAAVGWKFADSVLVFRRDSDGQWQREAALFCPLRPEAFAFGSMIAVDGGRVYAAATSQVFADNVQVYVSVFERGSSGSWEEVSRIVPEGWTTISSMSVEGRSLILGNMATQPAGEARVYALSGESQGEWILNSIFQPAGVIQNIAFGKSVDIDGNLAVVGAPRSQVGGVKDVGAIYVYTRGAGAGVWNFVNRLNPPRLLADQFGTSVRVMESVIAIGSAGSGSNLGTLGDVYVHEFSGPLSERKVERLEMSGIGGEVGAEGTFGFAGSGERLVVGAGANYWSAAPFLVFEKSKITARWRPVSLAPQVSTTFPSARRGLAVSGDTVLVRIPDTGSLLTYRLPRAFNRPPIIDGDDVLPLAVGGADYMHVLTATDSDVGDVLKLDAISLPDWMHLQDNGDGTAMLTGIARPNLLGRYTIVVSASDHAGARVVRTFA